MDRSSNTDGTLLNTQANALSMKCLRLKNPLQTQNLLIKTPSVGYTDLVFSYATMRSAGGAEYQQVFYATNATQDNWTALSAKYIVSNSYEIKTFQLTDTAAYNNENLVFKIVFSGDNTLTYSGKTA